MAVVAFNGYGSGYDSNHPFSKLGRSLAKDAQNFEQLSLPSPKAPRLEECIEFFKARLLKGDITELYLHSLAVNVLKIAVHEIAEAGQLKSLYRSVECIFLITPGLGNRVDTNYFPHLKEFYISERATRAQWAPVLSLSAEKPVIVLSADDKYLLPIEIFKLKKKNTANQYEESNFHWMNLPEGYRHFDHETDPELASSAIDAVLNCRKILKGELS